MSLDLVRGPDFQRMTKGTPGDEVDKYGNNLLHAIYLLEQIHDSCLQS